MSIEKIIIPVLVFFNDDFTIDVKANHSYIEMLNESSIESVILLGTTSEGVVIGFEDKVKLIKLYCEKLNKKIFLAPSIWAISDFKYLSKISKKIEDSLFLPTAYFNRNTNDLIKYMRKVYDDLPVNIYLYNLPKNTACNFTPELIYTMRQSGLNIKGIKLSHSHVESIPAYKEISDLEVFFGSDKNIKAAIKNGADAVVAQNLAPSVFELTRTNLQTVADRNRALVLASDEPKIKTLKSILSGKYNEFSDRAY
jgi:4-hydroxy-tetrahydrodipicolinate synthase